MLTAQISYEAAYMAALALEAEAAKRELPRHKRRALRSASEALWALINDTAAIELEGCHASEV